MALTPVAVVMFRHNNPDALLTLIMVSAAALTLRAAESGRLRWVLGASAVAGFGFLVKTTRALLLLPALAIAYLAAAPISLRRRMLHLGAGLAVFLLAAGWWIAPVRMVPETARPYIGGTDTNSVLEYAPFGYNGLDRLLGEGSSSLRDGAWGGAAGWTRLFNDQVGGQISWLLPVANRGRQRRFVVLLPAR
jgi:4-amino-4-deoxy-L-arabinose transferase-like glycosyltransferase